jgi:hypothetical protein
MQDETQSLETKQSKYNSAYNPKKYLESLVHTTLRDFIVNFGNKLCAICPVSASDIAHIGMLPVSKINYIYE